MTKVKRVCFVGGIGLCRYFVPSQGSTCCICPVVLVAGCWWSTVLSWPPAGGPSCRRLCSCHTNRNTICEDALNSAHVEVDQDLIQESGLLQPPEEVQTLLSLPHRNGCVQSPWEVLDDMNSRSLKLVTRFTSVPLIWRRVWRMGDFLKSMMSSFVFWVFIDRLLMEHHETRCWTSSL